jgi:photosystem II stability/assembly factor-like uncharacterized protein
MNKILQISFFFLLFVQIMLPQWMVRTSGTTNNLKAVDFIDAFNITVVGAFGTILRSTDGGTNWFVQSSGTTKDLYGVSFANENYGVAVGANGIILSTTDGGVNWASQVSGITTNLYSVSFSDPNNGIAVGTSGNIIGTTNGGVTWIQQNSGTTNNLRGVQCFDPSNSTVVGENGTILRTTNGGEIWIEQDAGSNYLLRGVSCCDTNNCTAVGVGDIILKTTNGGNLWILQRSGIIGNLYSVSVPETNHVNAVGSNGNIIGTIDGGNTWMIQPGWTERDLFGVSFVNPDTGIAVGNYGVIRMTYTSGIPVELTYFTASIENGAVVLIWETATELNNHLFEIERRTEKTEYRTIGYVEGAGTTTEPRTYKYLDRTAERGINFYRLKQIDYNGTFKYSDEIEVNAIGSISFSLEQNYPNPFNPSTTINYSIKEKGFVTLKVFDILGNEVKTLVNDEQDAGSYKFNFDASSFSSGIYFYALKAGEFFSTKKMILLK